MKLARTVQCAKCPWKKSTNPHDIPNGYSEDKHCALSGTIAKPASVADLFATRIRVMACHEEHEAHCVGWLTNQLGPGNNLALRIQMRNCENIREVKTVGPQHQTFEDTLP
jgi:hypothetical protein